jgi:hypothetical protein
MKVEIRQTPKTGQFNILGSELRAIGREDLALQADTLGAKYPSADLMAYHQMQEGDAISWHGFVFMKVREIKEARSLLIAIRDIEETERLGF